MALIKQFFKKPTDSFHKLNHIKKFNKDVLIPFFPMQKIFKIWLIGIFFITLLATFIVNTSSPIFGFLLLPILVVTSVIIILGYYTERK